MKNQDLKNISSLHIFKDFPYSEMLRIEGNEFIPTFFMGKYPVTQALWEKVMGTENNRSNFKGLNRPVERVSWKDICLRTEEGEECFLSRLNRHSEKVGGIYRLPSEAEWEYTAKCGENSKGYESTNYSPSNRRGNAYVLAPIKCERTYLNDYSKQKNKTNNNPKINTGKH